MIRLRTPFAAAALFTSVAVVGLTPALAQTAPGSASSTAAPSEARHHAMGRMPGQFVEGRIAFLKAELKITPAQEPQWQQLASEAALLLITAVNHEPPPPAEAASLFLSLARHKRGAARRDRRKAVHRFHGFLPQRDKKPERAIGRKQIASTGQGVNPKSIRGCRAQWTVR